MSQHYLPAGLVLWVLPHQDEAERWQALIDSLALRHGTDRFQAHVTAASLALSQEGGAHQLRRAISSLNLLANEFGPITLPVSSPTTGPSFFQCVFCELPTEPIAAIGEAFLSLADKNGIAPSQSAIATQVTEHAHLSLIYSAMSSVERDNVSKTLTGASGSTTFDTICLVSPGEQELDFSNPQAWEVIAHAQLSANR